MTDTEIIEIIARRMGFYQFKNSKSRVVGYEHAIYDDWWGGPKYRSANPPDWLTSLDALQPVLATFSESERNKLLDIICNRICGPDLWELITLPPRTLAEAIATVIKESTP